MSWNVNDELTLSTVVRLNGAATDDAGLTLAIEAPSGATTTYHVADFNHAATGHYAKVLVVDATGVWRWTWTASGGMTGGDAGFFLVGTDLYQFEPWTTPEQVLATPALRNLAAGTPPVTADDPALREACDGATEFLHARTWRRFKGLREVELRPCCAHAYARVSAWLAWPMLVASLGGRYSNPDPAPVLEGPAACGCSPIAQITLPDDVRAVTQVLIDGVEFDGWRLDSGRRLTRTDLEAWPCCANVQLPETEDNTFSVHAVVGGEVPALAHMAARELAGELYLADADPSSCRIPTRISSMQRQGATYTRVDTTTLGKDGMLGLRITDIFLSQFGKRRREMQIASPDVPERTRRKGAGPF